MESTLSNLRTVPQTVKQLRELDPDCPITEHAIRKLVKDKKISYLIVGKRIYINAKELENCIITAERVESE